jgi:hypothetical protein
MIPICGVKDVLSEMASLWDSQRFNRVRELFDDIKHHANE